MTPGKQSNITEGEWQEGLPIPSNHRDGDTLECSGLTHPSSSSVPPCLAWVLTFTLELRAVLSRPPVSHSCLPGCFPKSLLSFFFLNCVHLLWVWKEGDAVGMGYNKSGEVWVGCVGHWMSHVESISLLGITPGHLTVSPLEQECHSIMGSSSAHLTLFNTLNQLF